MRLGILTSWPLRGTTGSGVVTSIRGFAPALAQQGVDVSLVAPVGVRRSATAILLQRIRYNGRLPGRIHRAERRGLLEALLGFDFDGCYLDPGKRPPLTVFCGGTLADILNFEQGWARQLLKVQARLEAQNVRLAQRTVVPSRYAADAVTRHYEVDPRRLHVVPLGVDALGWDAVEARLPDPLPAPPVVLCVARLYPRKGHDLLLEAWRGARARLGAGTLLVVGSGPLERSLRNRAGTGGYGGIRFEGDVADPGRLKGYYQCADLFCLPSRHETYGLVYREAALHRLPSVALAGTAVPEVIDHGRSGWLVETGGRTEMIAALTGALVTLLEDSRLLKRLGEAAAEDARGRTWLQAAADLLPFRGS